MKRVLGILGTTALGILFLATPAYAELPPVGGQFCANAEHGIVAKGTNGVWYKCTDTPGTGPWKWLPTTSPAPSATKPQCDNGWYVNEDETKLMPSQQSSGMMFDGPSLVHHKTTPVSLATVPTDGAFATVGAVTGVPPLFKMETTAPYSTINKTGAGKYWSSKVVSGPGSQGSPVDSPADLVGKWNYTVDTKVVTFGVGYANDTGNKALIGSVTFGGHVYPMKCPSPSASSSHSASPSAAVVTLPVTGSTFNTIAAVGSGVTLLAVGVGLVFFARRRRTEFRSE